MSSANDAWFEDKRIDDSGHIGTYYNDHDESQLKGFLGENFTSLLHDFDL